SLYRPAVARLEDGMPATGIRLGPVLVGHGRTLVAAGRAADARPLLERGLTLTRRQFGEADWRTAEARLGLGACLAALGRADEARLLLQQSRDALGPYRLAQPDLIRHAERALTALGPAPGERS
ncbi:MAG TPA: tetratricopeptide repeat protein, partial [Gemmatimonadales bacterium]|nr:tetratricopeptide repeat protein [Gemmatimonadales bacterium]